MNKYKYTSYDYSKIIKPSLKLCYPNSNFYGECIIQNAELKNDTVYVTYYDGIDRITIEDFNIRDLIGTENG